MAACASSPSTINSGSGGAQPVRHTSVLPPMLIDQFGRQDKRQAFVAAHMVIMGADIFVAGMADHQRAGHQFERSPALGAAETALAHIGDGMARMLLDKRLGVRPRRAAVVVHGDRPALPNRGCRHGAILALRARRSNRKQHLEQRPAAGAAGAFDRQQPALGDAAAIGGNPVRIAAGFEHAVAGHDDHEGIFCDRLRHGMDGAGSLQARRDLAIGHGFAARNGAGEVIDPGVERRDAGHIEPDLGQIGRLAAQQRRDALDGALDVRGRAQFAGVGEQLEQPAPGFDLARLRQLHAQNTQTRPMRCRIGRPTYRIPCTHALTYAMPPRAGS